MPREKLPRGSVSRGLLDGVGDDAIWAVVGEAMGSQEDGDRAVWILVNADGGLDEVWPQTARWQLQTKPPPLHRVVVADTALLLDAKNLGPGGVRSHTKPDPSCSAETAKAALCCGM